MFLAGKVEETPQKLRDVISLSYEIRNKKDPTAAQRIKQQVTGVLFLMHTLHFEDNQNVLHCLTGSMTYISIKSKQNRLTVAGTDNTINMITWWIYRQSDV
jgi:hypothetical protein